MASSLNIQEVQLNNTFDEFRLRTNTVIAELNKFGTGSATVTVGSLETSTGLGEDGHLTVNGDLLVTGNATIEGNLTFGNAETDTISFVADIASNVLPDTPYNFSLGSATKQWQDLYLSGTAAINIVTAQSATVVNDFTVDTNTFHVDSTTNRIGILDTSPEVTLDIGSATDAIHIPVGTTAERPGSPESGFFRYNTSLSQFEGYTTTWGAIGGGGTNTFTTDIFTGDNSTTDFVLSQATEFDTSLMVFIDGVYQTPNAYDISTTLGITTLSFSAAPANGRTIVAYVVAAGVSGNNLNQNLFTGDGATVTYTLSIAPVNKNNTQVFIDGVYQQKDAYSVSGYDVTFTDPPPDQTTIEVMTFTQTEVNVPVDGTIKSIHLSGDLVTPGALDVTTDLTVTGTTTLNGNLVIGDANTDTITISSEISSSLIPSQDITYDLGASGNAWRDLYLAGSTIYIGGGKLEYNDTLNQFELKNAADAVVPVSLSANSTTDLSEGTRLYYTTGRVLSDGTSIVPGGSLAGTVGDAALQYRADGNYSGTPQQGSFYFDGLNSRLKVYTGASFIDAVPVSGGGGGATTDANATFSKYLYTIASQTNVVTGASDEVVGYTQLYIGKDYEIVSESSTDFIAFGATTGTVGETFTVDSDGTSNIADLVLAKEYEIVTAGDTDFTVIGAVDNNVGTVFTFNGVTSQSATTGTVIAEGNGTANPVLVYVVDDATSVEVYVNGIKQYEGATNDYVATTGSSVNFTYNLPVDALVDVQVYELLTNDAYYIKTETYSQAQVNTQISNALTIYDDQTASDARYVNIGGDTMTGNLGVTGSVTADGLTVVAADAALAASIGSNGQRVYITPNGTEISYNASGNSAGSHMFQTGNIDRLNIASNGDISFYNTAGNSQALFWDASAESLGIGTSSPSSELTIGADTPQIDLLKASSADVLANIRAETDAGSGGKLVFQTKRNGNTALDRMTIDDDGNVGIGASSVESTLHLQAASAGGRGATLTIDNNAASTVGNESQITFLTDAGASVAGIANARIKTISTDAGSGAADLTFTTWSGSAEGERMRIKANGKTDVGGVANQTSAVLNARFNGAAIEFGHGNNGAGYYGTAGSYGNNGQPYIGFSCYSQENLNLFTTTGAKGNIITGDLSGNLTFAQITTATGTGLSPENRMTLDASGNLGIGASSPSSYPVAPNLVVDAGTNGGITIKTGSSNYGGLYFADGTTGNEQYRGSIQYSHDYAGVTDSLQFSTSGLERMRIDSSGNLLVGLTDAAYLVADSGVQLYQTGGARFGADGTSARNLISFVNGTDGTPAEVGVIQTNGSSTSYLTSSDRRLKENIADADDAGSKIDAIQVRKFDWKVDGSHQDYGMVAQELLEVAPEAVSAPEDPEEMMGVDYSKLVPMMIKAIQEQQEQIEQLKADIAVLKGAN